MNFLAVKYCLVSDTGGPRLSIHRREATATRLEGEAVKIKNTCYGNTLPLNQLLTKFGRTVMKSFRDLEHL